jgi:hypothetical protein
MKNYRQSVYFNSLICVSVDIVKFRKGLLIVLTCHIANLHEGMLRFLETKLIVFFITQLKTITGLSFTTFQHNKELAE